MIRKRTILSLALLASTAACGGGGGGGASGPAPAASSGAPAPTSAVSTNFNNPSVVASVDANGQIMTPTMAADTTSQTATLTPGDGTPDNPTTIHITGPGGVDHTFNTSAGLIELSDQTFNGAPINSLGGSQIAMFKDGNGGTLITDASGQLSFSNYGIWSHADGNGHVTSVGAFATGTETSATDLASQQGTATYQGSAVGTGSLNGQTINYAGTSTGTINWADRTAQIGLNMKDAGGGADTLILNSGALNMTGARFGGAIATSAASTVQASGTTAGAVFGDSAAEIGGVFAVSGANNSAIGAFGGVKQPPAAH